MTFVNNSPTTQGANQTAGRSREDLSTAVHQVAMRKNQESKREIIVQQMEEWYLLKIRALPNP